MNLLRQTKMHHQKRMGGRWVQAVVDTFGGLFLLRDSFEHTGLRYDVDACAPLTCIYCQLVFDMC